MAMGSGSGWTGAGALEMLHRLLLPSTYSTYRTLPQQPSRTDVCVCFVWYYGIGRRQGPRTPRFMSGALDWLPADRFLGRVVALRHRSQGSSGVLFRGGVLYYAALP